MLPLFTTSGCDCSYCFTVYAQSVYAKIVKFIFAKKFLFSSPVCKIILYKSCCYYLQYQAVSMLHSVWECLCENCQVHKSYLCKKFLFSSPICRIVFYDCQLRIGNKKKSPLLRVHTQPLFDNHTPSFGGYKPLVIFVSYDKGCKPRID
jgi:hypothetical protein